MAEIAVELAVRIRDDEPTAVHRWLRSEMDGEDWVALAVVLAAAVPVDEPWSHLTAWTWIGDLTEERFGPIPWRERYAKPRRLSTLPVDNAVHRLSRGLSTTALDGNGLRGSA